MSSGPIWHGTEQEMCELLGAIAGNCACKLREDGARLSTCAAHTLLTGEQRVLDRLLFIRYLAERLQREEWSTHRAASRATSHLLKG